LRGDSRPAPYPEFGDGGNIQQGRGVHVFLVPTGGQRGLKKIGYQPRI
jgi:hypothetical protein